MGSLSVVHWIIVLGLVGGVGYAIWRSRKAKVLASSVAEGGTLKTSSGPSGIGGWLILVAFGLLASIIKVLASIVEDVGLFGTYPPNAHIAIHAELAINSILLGFIVYATILFFGEKCSFPIWWKRMALLAALMPIIDGAIIAVLLNVPFGRLVTEKEWGQTIAALIAVGIWWWYLNVSVRVKNTFIK